MKRIRKNNGAIWQAQRIPTADGSALLQRLEGAKMARRSKEQRLRVDSVQEEAEG